MPTTSALRSTGFVGGVLATAFAVALGYGLIVPVLPQYARELGATTATAGVVVAVFALVRMLASGPAGALVDRLGARPNVATGLVIVAASSAATALVDTSGGLIAVRGAGGIGSALFITGIGQHVTRTVPMAERGRANGMLQGAFLLGGASGPIVGGLLVERAGVRAPFLVYAGTLAIAAVVTLRFMTGGADGASRPRAHGVELASLRSLLRSRAFVAVLVVHLAVAWASVGVRTIGVPLFAAEVLELQAGSIGLALTVSAVVQGIVLWPSSTFADRRGRLLPTRIALVVSAVTIAGLAVVHDLSSLIVWLALQGAAGGVAATVPATIVGDLAPPGAEGRAAAAMNVARDVGAIVGALATGAIAQAVSFDAAFVTSAAVLAVALVGTAVMRETLVR